jgi:hypothetical protein
MIENIQLRVMQFQCDVCGRSWINLQRIVLVPLRCPSCRSREWNGPKRPRHKNELQLPSPRRRGRPKVLVPDLLGDEEL